MFRIVDDIMTGFRKFCYSIRDVNYRQMRAYALYGIQPIFSSTCSLSFALPFAYHRAFNVSD